MKGIILAGGSGTRLYPLTRAVSKQLMPVYDKPLVYYPLSVLMLAGIRDILVITNPDEQDGFRKLLSDGGWLGLKISYAVQKRPRGIADALLVGKKFIGEEPVCLILGDNIFYGHGLPQLLERAGTRTAGATVFGYQVISPERYGVLVFNRKQEVVDILEKPKKPPSSYAVAGLYFYDAQVVSIASGLAPSARGELEITDVNRAYLKRRQLHVEKMGRGIAWLDVGTHESLQQASQFIQVIEERQGLKVGCVEEIAWRLGYVSRRHVLKLAESLNKNSYGEYLRRIVEDH